MKSFYLYLCAIFAALGGLLSGYDMGGISGAILYIEKSFNMTSELTGILVSSASLGAVIGAILNGLIIDKIGRKNTLILTSLIFITGSIFCFFSRNIYELILSRTFLGCAVGIVSFACPLYLSEISEKSKRGRIVSIYQLAVTFGILFSYLINYAFSLNPLNWRLMLSFGVIPALVMFFGIIFQKDTPRWYILKGKTDEAKSALEKFDNKVDVEAEIESIKSTISNSEEKLKFSKKLIMPFVIGMGMMFIQITTGINAIIYYAPIIFKQIGFNSNQDVLCITILIGIINFLMTFVAIALVDKIGRKPLLYTGLIGMLISSIFIGISFIICAPIIKLLAIIATATYIISFSMSLGPVALLLISEVFPLQYRGSAMSVAIVANFTFNFLTTALFPIALKHIGGFYTFLIFSALCFGSIIFIKFVVPETKGKSLEEIEKSWEKV